MNNNRTNNNRALGKALQSRRAAATLFACVACMWLALDMATKAYVNSGQFSVGQHIAGPFCGLFEFVLVHNTGAAWGMFNHATFGLGVFSLAMCVAIVLFFLFLNKNISAPETIGMALVFAGGIGNAIDRFAQGYVVDFIHFVFIDFPVFNIADIGVTCGMVLFLVSFILRDVGGNARGEKSGSCESDTSHV